MAIQSIFGYPVEYENSIILIPKSVSFTISSNQGYSLTNLSKTRDIIISKLSINQAQTIGFGQRANLFRLEYKRVGQEAFSTYGELFQLLKQPINFISNPLYFENSTELRFFSYYNNTTVMTVVIDYWELLNT
jgi:hypothetical protein